MLNSSYVLRTSFLYSISNKNHVLDEEANVEILSYGLFFGGEVVVNILSSQNGDKEKQTQLMNRWVGKFQSIFSN